MPKPSSSFRRLHVPCVVSLSYCIMLWIIWRYFSPPITHTHFHRWWWSRGWQQKKSRTPRGEISWNQVEIMRNQSRFPWNQARKSAQPSSPTHFYNIWRHFWGKSRGNQTEIRKSRTPKLLVADPSVYANVMCLKKAEGSIIVPPAKLDLQVWTDCEPIQRTVLTCIPFVHRCDWCITVIIDWLFPRFHHFPISYFLFPNFPFLVL